MPASQAKTIDRGEAARHRIAKWLKARRTRRGWTQKEVVEAVSRAGSQLSRGHLSNFESAAYAPSPPLIAVLDLVLDGGGDLIRIAEEALEVRIESPVRADVIDFARTVHEEMPRWAEDTESASEEGTQTQISPSPNHKTERPTQGLSRPASVIEGREEVASAVCDLLATAASQIPKANEYIELSGAFVGLRGDPKRAGLPQSMREALRHALERGWRCRHYIPSPPATGPEATALVYVAASLMPCPKYEPRLIDPNRAPTVQNLLVIPGVASVAFQGTTAAGVIDAAVIHGSDDEAARLIKKQLKHLASFGSSFVTRRPRSHHDPSSPILTLDELAQRLFLSEAAELEGPARLVVDKWPTSTIPPQDYKAMVDRRQTAARSAPSESENEVTDKDWVDMIDMQAGQFEALQKHLKRGFPYQVIITPAALRVPTSNENHWKNLNLEERKRHFRYIKAMLDKYENFEIGIAYDPLAHRIEKCRWEVHDKKPDGLVVVQTHYTPGLNRNEWRPGPPKECHVDLTIEAPAAVQSFSAYFSQVWLRTEPLQSRRLG